MRTLAIALLWLGTTAVWSQPYNDPFLGGLLGRWALTEAGKPDIALEGKWVGEDFELSGPGVSFVFHPQSPGYRLQHDHSEETVGGKVGYYYQFVFRRPEEVRYSFVRGIDHHAIQIDSRKNGYWQPVATQYLRSR